MSAVIRHTSLSFTMLASLPRDILRLALEDFLAIDVFGLSCLDVAFCNHQHRADAIRALLSEVRPFEDADIFYKTPQQLCGHMTWLSNRKVMAKQLTVFLDCIEDAIPRELPDIEELVFCIPWDDNNDGIVHIPTLAPFIACFPNLKILRCWSTIKDLALQQFYHMTCPLEVLDLGTCCSLSPDVVVTLAALVKHSLRELVCDCLGHRAVKELARIGLRLRRLEVSYQLIRKPTECLQLLAASMAETLEELVLARPDPDIIGRSMTVELVAMLAASCPNIKVLHIDSDSHTLKLCEVLTAVLMGSPTLVCFKFQGHHHQMTGNNGDPMSTFAVAYPSGTRICDVELGGCEPQDRKDSLFVAILNTLAACNVVLRKLRWRFYGRQKTRCSLSATLAQHVGAQFDELEVDFNLNNQDLGDILSRWPNLTSLSICGDLVTDANIALIPRYCPKMISLELRGDKLSDDAVCIMLEEFRGGHLKVLTLGSYSPVIVEKIAEVLSRLDNLTITSSVVDKEHLLALLLTRSLQVASLKLDWHIISWFGDELKAARFMPMPKLVDGHT